jgi:hypothetical protein
MQSTLRTHARMVSTAAAWAVAWIACSVAAPAATASEAMPAAQQSALVQKYCAVCHNDAHLNGGLSLEHFDAADADPGVAAMLVSKLTNGVALQTIHVARTDPAAAALLAGNLKTGAMGAAGIPVPDRETQEAWVNALAGEAAGASGWTVNRTQDPATRTPVVTASMAQEVSSATKAGEADTYRLTLTCRTDSHEGEMLLAWAAGVPKEGHAISAAVDGRAPVTYHVLNEKAMFIGAVGTSGTGAAILSATKESAGAPKIGLPLPERTLTISNVFPDETVMFPFDGLPQTARQALVKCFPGSDAR